MVQEHIVPESQYWDAHRRAQHAAPTPVTEYFFPKTDEVQAVRIWFRPVNAPPYTHRVMVQAFDGTGLATYWHSGPRPSQRAAIFWYAKFVVEHVRGMRT